MSAGSLPGDSGGQAGQATDGTKKLRTAGQEWAPGCPDRQERCVLTDLRAATLRVTDEAARKGRQRDPGLVHIYGLTDGIAPRFRPGFSSSRRSFAFRLTVN